MEQEGLIWQKYLLPTVGLGRVEPRKIENLIKFSDFLIKSLDGREATNQLEAEELFLFCQCDEKS